MLRNSLENGPVHPACISAVISSSNHEQKIVIREVWMSRKAHEAFLEDLETNNALAGIRHLFSDLAYNLSSINTKWHSSSENSIYKASRQGVVSG